MVFVVSILFRGIACRTPPLEVWDQLLGTQRRDHEAQTWSVGDQRDELSDEFYGGVKSNNSLLSSNDLLKRKQAVRMLLLRQRFTPSSSRRI